MARDDHETTYVAHWIFPVCSPPINDGFLRVVNGCVVEIGKRQPAVTPSGRQVDLGDVALIPKLVNAHTHLEFSDCERPIGEQGVHLADWIGQVITSRGRSCIEQRNVNLASGIAESARAGVATIADIATPPCRYPQDLAQEQCVDQPDRRLEIVSFAETLGLSELRAGERLESARQHRLELSASGAARFGISPHAPYSTPPALVKQCVEDARRHVVPVAMHVAESPDERTLLKSGSGPFAESLVAAGLWQDGLFPWPGDQPTFDLLKMLSEAPRALIVHGNDLNDREIQWLAAQKQMTVVYCPRTHDFFGYEAHPVAKLADNGVRVALGTDSRASNPDLSIWREIQFLLRNRVDLAPDLVLAMGTQLGAQALFGEDCRRGTISVGCNLHSIAGVPTQATTIENVWSDFANVDLQYTNPFGLS